MSSPKGELSPPGCSLSPPLVAPLAAPLAAPTRGGGTAVLPRRAMAGDVPAAPRAPAGARARAYLRSARRSARVCAWKPARICATDRLEPQSWQWMK